MKKIFAVVMLLVGSAFAQGSGGGQSGSASGAGTVTSVSVTTANGVSGTVATPTSTPAISLTLGAITPTTVNGLTISTSTGTLTIPNGVVLTGPASSGTALISGGPGGTPSAINLANGTALPIGGIAALGTGVATALGNTTNAASGLLTFSGAFGTPTSLVLTNATGLPLSAIGNVAGGTVLANTTNASGNVAATTTLTLGVPSGGGSPVTGTLSLCAAASASCALLTPVGTAVTFNGQIKASGYNDTTIGATTSAMTNQTTATCTTITNMSWTIAASKNYRLDCRIPRTLATTATLQYCLSGPGTATSYSLFVHGANGAAGVWADTSLLAQTAYAGKTTASSAAANTTMDIVSAQVQNGTTAGTLALQTAANGTNAITVLANANCVLTQEN